MLSACVALVWGHFHSISESPSFSFLSVRQGTPGERTGVETLRHGCPIPACISRPSLSRGFAPAMCLFLALVAHSGRAWEGCRGQIPHSGDRLLLEPEFSEDHGSPSASRFSFLYFLMAHSSAFQSLLPICS